MSENISILAFRHQTKFVMLCHLYFAGKDNSFQASTELLDHLGLVAGAIKDLGLAEVINVGWEICSTSTG